MSQPPRVFAREVITPTLQLNPDVDVIIKRRLADMIAAELVDKIDYRRYNNPSSYDVVYEASLIAMTEDEFVANYGYNHQRRGIADGTMAIMQNGNWKVLGGITTPLFNPIPNSVKPTPKQVEVKKTKQSAVDYLTEKMRNA